MMRMLDLQCTKCGFIVVDHFQRTSEEPLPGCPHRPNNPILNSSTRVLCGAPMERVFLPTHRGTVISDECDVVVKHGICWPDGTPRRYGFKSEMRAEAARLGLVNHVEHMPTNPGTDSSRHTSRWV